MLAMPIEAVAAFGLWFAPGWANGWAFAPIHVVWPIGMSLLAFVLFETASAALRPALVLMMQASMPWSLRACRLWLGGSLLVGALLAVALFFGLHTSAHEIWPRGYNP